MFLPVLFALLANDAPSPLPDTAVTAAAEAPPETAAPATPATEPATTATPTAAASSRVRVLVLDLQAVGVDEETTRTINGVLASLVSQSPSLDVATSADLRTLVDVTVQQQSLGCDVSSCLGELAGAFGAKYILYGDLGHLDEDIIVNVSLFDASAATAVGRSSVTVHRLTEVRERLRPAMAELLVPLGGLPDEEKSTSPLFIGGLVAAGLGTAALVAGGAFATVAELTAANADAPIDAKEQALKDGSVALVVSVVGAVVAVGGAAAALVPVVFEAE